MNLRDINEEITQVENFTASLGGAFPTVYKVLHGILLGLYGEAEHIADFYRGKEDSLPEVGEVISTNRVIVDEDGSIRVETYLVSYDDDKFLPALPGTDEREWHDAQEARLEAPVEGEWDRYEEWA